MHRETVAGRVQVPDDFAAANGPLPIAYKGTEDRGGQQGRDQGAFQHVCKTSVGIGLFHSMGRTVCPLCVAFMTAVPRVADLGCRDAGKRAQGLDLHCLATV